MTDAPFLANLLAYSVQVACLVSLGAVLPTALRVTVADVRYLYFQALLALCLILPLLQGRPAIADAGATVTAAVSGIAVAATPVTTLTGSGVPWMALLSGALAIGAVVRLAWLAIGLLRLERLRTAGQLAPACDEHDALQAIVGARAEIRYVPGAAQPVTFGVRRPVILLPETLRDCPPHIRRAVVGHELVHVHRRDWLWLLGEEVVRAVFWFHPAVWWLISRVQLAREEVVDELAVLATGSRRGYAAALMAFADVAPRAPTAAFGRRRHLFRRMTLITKEAAMSSTRIVLSSAVMTLAVSCVVWVVTDTFPLTSPVAAQEALTSIGPLERQAKPITPENPVPRRAYSVAPWYPAELLGARGTVSLVITIDRFGRVGEVRRLGVRFDDNRDASTVRAGEEALVRAATDAVRQWEYDAPADGPIALQVSFRFEPDVEATLVQHGPRPPFLVAGLDQSPQAPGTETRLRFSRERGIERAEGALTPAVPGPVVRVGSQIRPPTKVKDVRPVYPPEARNALVQGVVILEAVIGADGRIEEARVLRSIPLLDRAALEAVSQWEFTPTLLNGQPTAVVMTVTVQFSLT